MGMGAAAIGAAAIGAGASIHSGNKASKAASQAAGQAADAQLQATNATVAEQRRQFDLTRGDYAPFREGGLRAFSEMEKLAGLAPASKNFSTEQQQRNALLRFRTDPGYKFAFGEGQKAIERSAAARGMQMSGATLKALDRFGQNTADQQYGNYWNRLAGRAGVGQTATAGTAAAGQGAANAIGNALMQGGQGQADAFTAAGNARSSAYQNIGSSINSGINNALYAYGRWGTQ